MFKYFNTDNQEQYKDYELNKIAIFILEITKEEIFLLNLIKSNSKLDNKELNDHYVDLLGSLLERAKKLYSGESVNDDFDEFINTELYEIFGGLYNPDLGALFHDVTSAILNHFVMTIISHEMGDCDIFYIDNIDNHGITVSLYEARHLKN